MFHLEEIYSIFCDHPAISTDSRKITPGSIFFAIKGDQFDGNRFAADALAKGAAYAVIDNPEYGTGDRFILVENSLHALQQLAALHRERIGASIIGITGSNGKTTTKELIGRVLESAYKTVITRGNLNNHIGVPLTILSIDHHTRFAVVEMGANHPGEIASLCRMAQPGYGIITNIGKAHLEGFGGYEGVIRAKSELYEFIRQNKGLVFINADDQLLLSLSGGLQLSTYGSGVQASCRGEIAGRDPFLAVKWEKGTLKGLAVSNLFGEYNFENIMAAINIGLHFGIPPEKIDRAINSYLPDNNRSQWIKTERNVLVMDAYNANPSSMNAALVNFNNAGAKNKMVILGDMMELGDESLEEHRKIIALANELSFRQKIFIGEYFSKAHGSKNGLCFAGIDEAEKWLRDNPLKDMTILLKGSRKMQLEKLADLL